MNMTIKYKSVKLITILKSQNILALLKCLLLELEQNKITINSYVNKKKIKIKTKFRDYSILGANEYVCTVGVEDHGSSDLI